MNEIVIKLMSFYLMFVGVWRLGNSTISVSPQTKSSQLTKDTRKYNPLYDLFAVKSMILWSLHTLRNFNSDEFNEKGVISHKKFAWGLFWILLAIVLQQSVK